jgi:hypothetical protein
MKSILALCAVALLVVQAVPACADELDELLASEPVVASAVDSAVQPTASDNEGLDFSHGDNLDYRDAARWQSTVAPVPVAKQRTPSTASTQKAAQPADDFSVVPEPSAIALAVIALAYFLVFGRRRRLA